MDHAQSQLVNASAELLAQSVVSAHAVTLGTALPRLTKGIYIGSGGYLWLTFADGTKVEHSGLLTGMYYPLVVSLIESGTSAASVIAYF